MTGIVASKPPQSTIDSFLFTVEGMGNRTSITDLLGLHNYGYDNIYQLLQAIHPTIPTEQFSYDPAGNRTTADGVTIGNPVSKTYTYDWENRLTEIDYFGMVAQYKYDPFGRRIEKSVNGDITTFVYDGPSIIADYDGNGNLRNAYLHNLGIDDPLALQQGGQIYYYHKDGLGSITEITDLSGNTIGTYGYNSFGEIVSQTGNLIQPFTFTAREFDPENGLYYYRARYYDPRTGIFVSEDPIGLLADVNLYRYVQNNPISYKDALGLQGQVLSWLLKWAAGKVAGYLAGKAAQKTFGDPMERGAEWEREVLRSQYLDEYEACIRGCSSSTGCGNNREMGCLNNCVDQYSAKIATLP